MRDCPSTKPFSSCYSGQEVRLTNTRSGDRDAVTAGLPSYVMQEEFKRFVGVWWRPESEYITIGHNNEHSCGANCDATCDTYRATVKGANSNLVRYDLLYEEVDESEVEPFKISSWDGQCEEYRFPKPGEQNAKSTLKMVSFNYDVQLSQIVIESAQSNFPVW